MTNKQAQALRETDLYEPIRDFLVSQGYSVRAEVADCDIAAYKEGELLIVELKRRFSVDLLVQAIDRQAITDSVYVALPGPYDPKRGSRWRAIRRLLRRLELGLIVVDFPRGKPRVRLVSRPTPYVREKQNRKRLAVLEEMIGRSGNRNLGGSTRQKLVTAYRENAIHIACCLARYGPLTPKQLRKLGSGGKTTSILYKDVYGWFEHLARGVYTLSPSGRTDLASYPDLVAAANQSLDELPPPAEQRG